MMDRATKSGLGLPSWLLVAAAAGFMVNGSAQAYVGPSYMQIPGIPGDAKTTPYAGWQKFNAHLWSGTSFGGRPGGAGGGQAGGGQAGRGQAGGGQRGGGPGGGNGRPPSQGKGELVISVDKKQPSFKKLMALCTAKSPVAEVSFAESPARQFSFGAGGAGLGAGPGAPMAAMPDDLVYKLKNVRFTDCPDIAGAPEQAIFVGFDDIQWLNADRARAPQARLAPVELGPKETSGTTKTFVLTWFAAANDVSDTQCPVLNEKPPQELYYAYMSREEADKERIALQKQGGPEYHDGQMAFRGPRRLSVPLLPGIVPDPGFVFPQTKIARGIDLDGDDGSGKPPAGICKHKNYSSADGRTGIDNQFYTVAGCVAGWQGHKGFIMQYNNNAMHDGAYSILIEISGIDNERNDDNVSITWLFSETRMAKGPAPGQILPDYTFKTADNPRYATYHSRTHGRIVNGVVESDPVNEFRLFNGGISGTPPELRLAKARMRLEITPDGNLKGVLGGYLDWQMFASTNMTSNFEQYFGYQTSGLYNALRREADGLQDPQTGECNGISTQFDVEGVPAFIAKPRQNQLANATTQTDKAK